MTDIEILMMDGPTKSEAEKHLKNGTTVFDGGDFEKHFESYMDEWGIDEDGRAEYRAMIDEKKPATDWGIVHTMERHGISCMCFKILRAARSGGFLLSKIILDKSHKMWYFI